MDQDKTQKRRGNLAALRTLDKVPGMEKEHVERVEPGDRGGSGQGIKNMYAKWHSPGSNKEVDGEIKGPCLCLRDGVGGGHGLGWGGKMVDATQAFR